MIVKTTVTDDYNAFSELRFNVSNPDFGLADYQCRRGSAARAATAVQSRRVVRVLKSCAKNTSQDTVSNHADQARIGHSELEIADKATYLNRREFIKAAAAAGVLASGSLASEAASQGAAASASRPEAGEHREELVQHDGTAEHAGSRLRPTTTSTNSASTRRIAATTRRA